MAAKPSDYFFGVHDFFALIVPGALLSLWLLPALQLLVNDVAGLGVLDAGFTGSVAFLLFSFVVGQGLYTIAARLDSIGDPLIRDVLGQAEAPTAIVNELPEGKLHYVGAAWLRLNAPAAAVDLDRTTALSKFYRSLAIVFLVFAAGGYARADADGWSWSWHPGWIGGSLLIALLSFGGYVYYRHRHRTDTILYLTMAMRPSRGT